MTLAAARDWLATLPFRDVNTERRYNAQGEDDPDGAACDPHAYVILGWREVDARMFWQFVELIRAEGYRGHYAPPYDPDRVMTNTYLQVDEWIYWFIGPRQLARHHSSRPQHEPIRASGRRPFGGR